jgi:hypothetical protein
MRAEDSKAAEAVWVNSVPRLFGSNQCDVHAFEHTRALSLCPSSLMTFSGVAVGAGGTQIYSIDLGT